MSPTPNPEPSQLDALLDDSAPIGVELPADVGERFKLMIADAKREARPVRRLRRHPRAAMVGIALVICLGGGTAAAAMTLNEWAPWAEVPDGTYQFTLPSGAQCEARIGNVKGRDTHAETIAAAREYLQRVDLLAAADAEAMAEVLRFGSNGDETVGISRDAQYIAALGQGVVGGLYAELERQGFDPGSANLSVETETHCPGAEW